MPVRFEVNFDGLDRLIQRLDAAPEELAPAVEGGLFELAEETMSDAKAITPVDEGTLRASGHVRLPEREGDVITVALGFGGPAGSGEGQTKDVGYAVPVHEDLTAHHPVGQAKFLETPVDARRRGFGRLLADKIRARLG